MDTIIQHIRTPTTWKAFILFIGSPFFWKIPEMSIKWNHYVSIYIHTQMLMLTLHGLFLDWSELKLHWKHRLQGLSMVDLRLQSNFCFHENLQKWKINWSFSVASLHTFAHFLKQYELHFECWKFPKFINFPLGHTNKISCLSDIQWKR